MNYNLGRKMLTTEKHVCHYLTLLEVVFEKRLPDIPPPSLPSISSRVFPLSESAVDSRGGSGASGRGLRVLHNSWCQAKLLLRYLVELCLTNHTACIIM